MPLRFVDLDTRRTHIAKAGFIGRKRSPSLTEQFFVCFGLIIVGASLVMLVDDSRWLIAILFVLMGFASTYITKQTNKNRDLVQSTEFQSALFASALTKGYDICFIAAKDGEIIYTNPGFLERFPGVQVGANVRDWLTAGKALGQDSAAVLECFEKDQDRDFSIALEEKTQRKITLTTRVDVIPKPQGYFLLRGNEAK